MMPFLFSSANFEKSACFLLCYVSTSLSLVLIFSVPSSREAAWFLINSYFYYRSCLSSNFSYFILVVYICSLNVGPKLHRVNDGVFSYLICYRKSSFMVVRYFLVSLCAAFSFKKSSPIALYSVVLVWL